MRNIRILACLVLVAAACGGGSTTPDANERDAATDAATVDAATVDATVDAAVADARTPDAAVADAAPVDARVTDARTTDARVADAATNDAPAADARVFDATPPDGRPDALPPDAFIDTSGEIAAARATADGAGLTLPIERAVVTYLKPAVGTDPAGFTIQAAQLGPALFIAVDPATLTPAPARGDTVTFTITAMGSLNGLREATAISGFGRDATGADINALSQEVSAATDLVTNLDGYESEIVDLSATLAGSFVSAGSGFEKATLTSAGISGNTAFTVRVPTTLRDGIDLVTGCHLAMDNVPVGRLTTQTQVGAFASADLTVTGCPAPTVQSAVAVSSTSVQITFSRHVNVASLHLDGTQFTFDNGLTATAAVVSLINGRVVTVSTSPQTPGTTYLVTVGNSLTDLQGTALGAPTTATFTGYQVLAVVRINEVNANIANACDLIELRVIAGGSMAGYKLQERDTQTLVTFPTFTVAKNDLIVVHMNNGATCNPGTAVNETTAVNAQPKATFGANFDTAFDFYSADTGLTNTDNVFTLYDNAGVIMDAVFLSDDPAGLTSATGTENQAAVVGAASQWSPTLATYIDTVFRINAGDDLNATGTTAAGSSIQRIDDTDDNDKADWSTGAGPASTWGERNVGQNAL